ncbi:hypothetical protein PLICRDRAFT_174157 [Plicaturopsis crispa FD-325 SS-3]|nr:hypothetical protein PLICRDRAFT_174157 [Plicaturopsis crispa FD-325 SS-3]
MEYEAKSGHRKKGGLLPVTHRPKEIHKWMKCGRPAEDTPVAPSFCSIMPAWWAELQPPSRIIVSEDEGFKEYSQESWPNDWGKLNTAGSCGILQVVWGLAWWRVAATMRTEPEYLKFNFVKNPQEGERWIKTVRDVSWVLGQMSAGGGSPEVVPAAPKEKPHSPTRKPWASRKRGAEGVGPSTRASKRRK